MLRWIWPLLICVAQGASAQVYELSGNGVLAVREGGGAVAWRDTAAPDKPSATGAAGAQAGETRIAPVTAPLNLTPHLNQIAARYALSSALLEALVWQESRWRAGAVSPKGARGLTQLMPATAQALGVAPEDPVANLEGGARYLRLLLDHFGGDLERALAAYNAGVARVERAGGIPPIRETRLYVASILARLAARANTP